MEILRLAVRRERLPEAPEGAPPPAARPRASPLAVLFAREELPLDPEPPPRPRGAGPWRALFPHEPLPLDPPEERPPRARWLAWLFGPERLDPR